MLKRILALLGGGAEAAGAPGKEGLELAAAALMMEAALLDGHADEKEVATIEDLLARAFGLDGATAARLVENAREQIEASGQLYPFTRVIKDRFDHDERVRMIEMLWEVAYADGRVHEYEAALIRRVAGLLYVSDRESGEARKRVAGRAPAGAEGIQTKLGERNKS